jgi:DNA repair protein RadC
MDTRLLLGCALEVGATSIILFHNHPSGNKKESDADRSLTKRVQDAARPMELNVMDHIILTPTSYSSFADEGLL